MTESTSTTGIRDLELTHDRLLSWVQDRYPIGRKLSISTPQPCEDGFSGELLTFDVDYERDGERHSEGMVVRIEPGETNQLFLDTAFDEQYRALKALTTQTNARVPRAIGFEPDSEILGGRFFIMSREGGKPGVLWLEWMSGLSTEELERTWWSGLEAMAELHRLDPAKVGLDFLDQPARGGDQGSGDGAGAVRPGDVPLPPGLGV